MRICIRKSKSIKVELVRELIKGIFAPVALYNVYILKPVISESASTVIVVNNETQTSFAIRKGITLLLVVYLYGMSIRRCTQTSY